VRITIEKDVRVPTRDGVELATDVYLPQGDGPVPTLLSRTPYDKEVAAIVNLPIDVLRVARAGYAVVVQDTRGCGGSSGTWVPFQDEAADGEDAIAWIASQPWSDGRVGMFGQSYVGATQWAAARARPPALRALMPIVTSANPHDGWTFRGGAYELGFTLLWALMFLSPSDLVRRGADAADVAAVLAAADDADRLYARTPLTDLPELGDTAPYYREWLRRPALDRGWRDATTAGADVEVPALVVGGWYDLFLDGSLAAYRALREEGATEAAREGTRLIIGPWAHGVDGGTFVERNFGLHAGFGALDPAGLLTAWSDQWLREQAPDTPPPRVKLFVMGPDVWRDEDEWPLPDTAWTSYHLHAGGRLAPDAPGDDAADSFDYDPRDAVPTIGGATYLPGVWLGVNAGPRDVRALDGRQDVLRYATEPLEAPLEVTGPLELVLHASSSALDTDFVARLVDVAPDGRATGVTDGILRARYRDGPAEPTLLEAGRTYELRVRLTPTSWVFPVGHRLRLDVTSSNFPRFDRNTNTGGSIADERIEDAVVATNTVHHGTAHPSRLVLPVIDRG